jgi:hypothetical protein
MHENWAEFAIYAHNSDVILLKLEHRTDPGLRLFPALYLAIR